MKYILVKDAAVKWNMTERTIRNYCSNGKIFGAILNGKTWMIPENANKPAKTSENVSDSNVISGLINFLDSSTANYLAIENASKILVQNGFVKIEENRSYKFKKGDKVFCVRNGTSLLAFNIGNNINENNYSYHIIASHSDSPCFKIKPVADGKTDIYNKINVEPYGGMICSSWLDRPLGVAGRLIIKDRDGLTAKTISIDEDILMIPNLCIHFDREANSGKEYNMAIDMQPFYAQGLSEHSFIDYLAFKSGVSKKKIVSHDLYTFNRQKVSIWGENSEFISSPRLDDLECVYTSLRAFVDSSNNDCINTLYISDNEEVGCSSRQGADSDFLSLMIERITESLGFSQSMNSIAISNSFLISADNAHAVHPNFPSITDSDNKCYMNKGIAIKVNSSQRYTTDSISSAIFQEICEKAEVPFQFFANRSDKRGGSTLGNVLINHVSLLSVDVGLPQLAMHSSYETAGVFDISNAYKAFSKFYQSNILIEENKFQIK